jgi:prepilin-type N-terminal cleavage/methylation domain-containing protein
MKTVFAKPLKKSQRVDGEGFTLLELLVVLGVIAVLIALQLPALAAGKSQSKIAMCASHVRQLALACQIYANENNDRLPVLVVGSGASWAWDLPSPVANSMLSSGAQTNTFYCPGTAPRFTDTQNWSGPGTGINSTLWNYDATGKFHIVGYALAFSGPISILAATNQNTTIQLERIVNLLSGTSYIVPVSERVLVADATISSGAALPGYAHPENNYVSIAGGFQQNGMIYPHVSPHLKGMVPIGGNLGFKDGHVDWRKFELMTPRSVSGQTFWW